MVEALSGLVSDLLQGDPHLTPGSVSSCNVNGQTAEDTAIGLKRQVTFPAFVRTPFLISSSSKSHCSNHAVHLPLMLCWGICIGQARLWQITMHFPSIAAAISE